MVTGIGVLAKFSGRPWGFPWEAMGVPVGVCVWQWEFPRKGSDASGESRGKIRGQRDSADDNGMIPGGNRRRPQGNIVIAIGSCWSSLFPFVPVWNAAKPRALQIVPVGSSGFSFAPRGVMRYVPSGFLHPTEWCWVPILEVTSV